MPRSILRTVGIVLALLSSGLAVRGVDRALRAASVLLFSVGDSTSLVARYRADQVDVQAIEIVHEGRSITADRYRPRHGAQGHLVLIHGMHRLGHREPRLVALARGLARAGIEVVTPRIESLAEYRLDPQAVAEVGTIASKVAEAGSRPRVLVMGVSFAGGIALLAAADPRTGASIRGVVALGAQHDLGRVARWFAGEPARGPAGEIADVRPHPYGAQLFLREEPIRFFGERDAPAARELLGLCLQDDWRGARRGEVTLGDAAKRVLEESIAGRLGVETQRRLIELVDARSAELALLSPRGHLAEIRVPVLLLHGEEDPIVPFTETLHLARELPHARVLVTAALRHAEGASDASMGDRMALVAFMQAVLDLAAAPTH